MMGSIRLYPITFMMIAFMFSSLPLNAGNTVTCTITFNINQITEINVSGNPSLMNIRSASPGLEPNQEADSSTTYSISTNLPSSRIEAALNSGLPSDTTLRVQLNAPSGWSSSGVVTLGTSYQTLAAGGPGAFNLSAINYTFSANAVSGIISTTGKTVTYRLVQN